MCESSVLREVLHCYSARLPVLRELPWDRAHKLGNVSPPACCSQGPTCLARPAEEGAFAEEFQQCVILLRKRIRTRAGLGEPGSGSAKLFFFLRLIQALHASQKRKSSVCWVLQERRTHGRADGKGFNSMGLGFLA